MSGPETWILLGASRGLGRQFLQKALASSNLPRIFTFSRKFESLPDAVEFESSDFSREENWLSLLEKIRSLRPTRIFYFAGGGPFGLFQEKNWKDHKWSFRVSFEFPAFLLHQFLRDPQALQQFVVIGSSIAESEADSRASSYCAAKHALRGLITSIQKEQKPGFDLRLFSPGYMDTDLLPANAWPRQQAGWVKSPNEVAEMLWASIHNADDANKHFVLRSFP